MLSLFVTGSARVPALESRGAPVPWDGGRPPDWRDQGGGGGGDATTPNGAGYEGGGGGGGMGGGDERFNSQTPQKDQPKKAPRIVFVVESFFFLYKIVGKISLFD